MAMPWSAETPRLPTSPFKIELEPAFENVAAARRFVSDRLNGVSADRRIVDDLRLAASELVTNAVEHGDHGRVVVELGVNPDLVSLSVTSRSPHDRVGPVSDWAVADAGQITGRGLGIVRTLADDVSVSRGGGMLTITVERRLS
jgi:anti-sigma regulatory factor (Ser/Thr protein kinase)